MKIVIATPILYDKTSPFNHLFKDILTGFVDDGNTIIRIVATQKDSDTGYNLGIQSSSIEYIPVKRKPAAHGNIITRYINDTVTAIKMAAKIRKTNADVLFEDTCYSSFWAVRAAKKKGMKVVAMLQDVWPDNAVQSGLIGENGFLYKYFEAWQRYVYRKADRIICISDDMKKFIESKGVDGGKIEVIYNWGYSDEVVDIPWEDNRFVKKYGLDKNKFYAVYAGNIGRMQNVELVVEAARLLKDESKIEFLIIGDGVRKEAIAQMAAGLDNVRMLPMQPPELATSVYSAAGVNIIPLVEGGIKTALPSKTGVVLSCDRPVIFAFGETSCFERICKLFCAGECVSSSNCNKLTKAIMKYSKSNRNNYGSWHMYDKMFLRSKNIRRYADVVKKT